MPDTFQLEILTLEKVCLQTAARSLTAPGAEGRFGILPHHISGIFALQPGPLEITLQDGTRSVYALGGGFLHVQSDSVTIMARSIERADQIDRDRARRALDRAQTRVHSTTLDDEEIDIERARAALARASTRLKVAGQDWTPEPMHRYSPPS